MKALGNSIQRRKGCATYCAARPCPPQCRHAFAQARLTSGRRAVTQNQHKKESAKHARVHALPRTRGLRKKKSRLKKLTCWRYSVAEANAEAGATASRSSPPRPLRILRSCWGGARTSSIEGAASCESATCSFESRRSRKESEEELQNQASVSMEKEQSQKPHKKRAQNLTGLHQEASWISCEGEPKCPQ